jgi:hypothetical protein
MANVRPALRNEILRDLDNTAFGKDSFEVKIQEQDFLSQIAYRPRRHFTFYYQNTAWEGHGSLSLRYI